MSQKVIRSVFNIFDYHTTAGATAKEISPAPGITYQCLTVGETGRGRKEGRVPIKGSAPNQKVEAVSFYKKNEQPRFEAEALANVNSDACIALIRPSYGFRGGATYETLEGKVTELTTGYTAQGDAGGMATAYHAIAIIEKGALIKIKRSGRLYGESPTGYHFWDGQKWLSAKEKTVIDEVLNKGTEEPPVYE